MNTIAVSDVEAFARTVAGVHGADGVAWLDRLPVLLDECRERWGLVRDGSFPLSYRYVEPVRMADGTPGVLKLGPVGDPELDIELDAAEWFSGHGGARVLAIDRERGAVLLERALPGTPLVAEPEAAVVLIAADVMRALWRPPPERHRFRSVRELRTVLDRRSWAAGLYAELCDSMTDTVVLHGDLHHDNILRAGPERWVAIDAKGLVGEPAYETGALLRNPLSLFELPSPGRTLRRRADLLAEALDVDVARVRGWAYTQALLAAAWCVDDGKDPTFHCGVAALLEPLTRVR